MNDQPRLCGLRAEPLSVDEVVTALADPRCGGLVLFLGRVRDHDHGNGVAGLGYQAHPSAAAELESVCRAVAARHPGVALAAVHRTGELAVGDLAVVVGAASAHRDLAFTAARELIDTLKASVPIWKHQVFLDGSDEWVGLP